MMIIMIIIIIKVKKSCIRKREDLSFYECKISPVKHKTIVQYIL